MGITRHPVWPLVYFAPARSRQPLAERQVTPPLNLAGTHGDGRHPGRPALAAEGVGGAGLADAARLLVRLAQLAIEVPVIAELSSR
jgi:hypothetical protein